MDIFLTVLLFLAGIVLIVKGGDKSEAKRS